MKKYFIIISAATFSFFISKAQLTYQTVTSGLTAVSFEGGDSEVELGDIDGDGDLDIVTIGDHGSPNVNVTEAGIMVWKNNGTGTSWTLSKSGNLGYGGVALGDVDGDGKMDVAMGMHHNYATSGLGSQMVEVALGNGTGSSWTQASTGLLGNGTWGMFAPDFGDIDNDGKLDIVCTPFSYDDGLRVYKNAGGGSWTQTAAMPTGNIVNYNCKLGDFDNDGNLDMMTACQGGTARKGSGTGTFSSMATGLPSDWTMKFAIGDIDNNGSKDLAIVSSGAITTYKYSGSSWQTIGNTGLPTSGAKFVALADMDMDGVCDLLAFMATGITIYKGDGAGNWTANGTIATTINFVRGLAIGDLDHDGYSDIAYFGTSSSNNSLKVFLHTVASPVLGILPDFPKGNECLKPGSVQFAKWLAAVPAGPNATTTIEFSSTGTAGPWTTIVTNAPNSGVYQFVVPNVASPNCIFKYTITQGSSSQSVTTNAFGVGACTATGINEQSAEVQNLNIYPNPMNGNGYIEFDLATASDVEITLSDMLGKNANTVSQEWMSAGFHKISVSSAGMNAGIYFCTVKAGNVLMKGKMVVVK